MSPEHAAIALVVVNDPARRRRLVRRAALEAVRRGLKGSFDFHVEGSAVVACVDGLEVGRLDPWQEPDAIHD